VLTKIELLVAGVVLAVMPFSALANERRFLDNERPSTISSGGGVATVGFWWRNTTKTKRCVVWQNVVWLVAHPQEFLSQKTPPSGLIVMDESRTQKERRNADWALEVHTVIPGARYSRDVEVALKDYTFFPGPNAPFKRDAKAQQYVVRGGISEVRCDWADDNGMISYRKFSRSTSRPWSVSRYTLFTEYSEPFSFWR